MAFIPLKSKPVFQPLVESSVNIASTDGTGEFIARFEDMARFTSYGFVGSQGELIAANMGAKKLTPGEATAEFGLKGELEFDKPITREAAKLRQFKILRARDREEFIAKEAASEGFSEKVGNLTIALGTIAADPVNYIPFGSLGKTATLAKGVKANSLMQKALKNPGLVGAFDAAVGNAIVSPLTAETFRLEGSEYGVTDGLIDVGLGGVIGYTFGSLGRAFHIKSVLKTRANTLSVRRLVVDLEQALMAEKKAMASQLQPEGRASMDEYIQGMEQNGQTPKNEVLQALGKLQTALQKENKINSTDFLNEFILRNDISSLDPELQKAFVLAASKSEMIPSRIFNDFETSFRFLQEGRVAELPKGLSQIVEGLGGLDGNISVANFITGFDNLKKIDREEFLTNPAMSQILESIGIKKVTLETKLTAKQAFALFEELEKLSKTQKAPGSIDDILQFQSDLKLSKSHTEKGLKGYKKVFKKLSAFIRENPELRGLTVAELKGLDPVKKSKLLEFMRLFQEANPPEELLARALRGEEDAISEMFQAAKVNKELKDALTEQQALDIVRNEITGGGERPLTDAELLGVEGVQIKGDGSIDSQYLNERVLVEGGGLDEATLKDIDLEVEALSIKRDNIKAGEIEGTRCIFGA